MMTRITLTLLAVLVSAAVGQAEIITIDTDTVYDLDPFCFECGPQYRVVDGDDPPTVLDIVAPARLDPGLFRAPAVELRGMSVLNMSGGSVYADGGPATVLATSRSTVNVSGGQINNSGTFAISAVEQSSC